MEKSIEIDSVTDYTFAVGGNVEELIEDVKRLIDDGWQPQGGPIELQEDGSPRICQAMIYEGE